jgi:hypothetical protein
MTMHTLEHTLMKASIAPEAANYRGTDGVSDNNRSLRRRRRTAALGSLPAGEGAGLFARRMSADGLTA